MPRGVTWLDCAKRIPQRRWQVTHICESSDPIGRTPCQQEDFSSKVCEWSFLSSAEYRVMHLEMSCLQTCSAVDSGEGRKTRWDLNGRGPRHHWHMHSLDVMHITPGPVVRIYAEAEKKKETK